MGENTLKAVAFLAIIIGAAGAGYGAFTAWQVQTGAFKDQDGDDEDDDTTIVYVNILEYPCSSETEINNALTAIGTEYGIITIIKNITLSNKIEIDGGGNYIIQGEDAVITSANDVTFSITNAKSLMIQNIKINSSKLTGDNTNIIYINEASDNPVYIKNVHILGDLNTKGRGIYIDSDNVWVSECSFKMVRDGIWQMNGNKAHIYDNVIEDFYWSGITLYGTNNFIDGNFMNNTGIFGIITEFNSHNNSISRNAIWFFAQDGIYIKSSYNVIFGNYISNNTGLSGCEAIRIEYGDYNVIDANSCYNCYVAHPILLGIGIVIYSGNNITVAGNTSLFNENNFIDHTGTAYVYGNIGF